VLQWPGGSVKPQLTEPPRAVSPLLVAQLMLGSLPGRLGWLILGFGMIFFWAFGMNADVTAPFVFRGDLESVSATIVAVVETGFAEGGGDEDEGTPVLAHHYRFAYDGRRYEGISYALQAEEAGATPVEIDAATTVEFPRGHPERSRIRGMRSAPFPAFVVLVGVFPLVGLVLAAAAAPGGWRSWRLLRHGRLASGKLVADERTGASANRQPVHKLTFEFQDTSGGAARITVRTRETQSLRDDVTERLVYDPARPTRGTTLDHLPGSPRIDATGRVLAGSSWPAVSALAVPVLTIVGHGIYLVARYLV